LSIFFAVVYIPGNVKVLLGKIVLLFSYQVLASIIEEKFCTSV